MEQFLSLASLDRIGAVAAFLLMAGLVITDKLVWHTRLTAAEKRADRWERIALEALTGPAQAGVKAAEVAVGVVSALPDPSAFRASADNPQGG